jgi:hypothetical protein
MNLINSKYIEWLIKIGPSVIGFLGGFLSGFLSSYKLLRIKVRGEIRQKHFNEIKQKVLEPVLKRIAQHHIPVLQHNNGSLYIKNVPIYGEESVLKPLISGYREEIAVKDPVMYMSSSIPHTDQHLLSDVKDHHYSELVDRFENIQEDFNKYNNSCRVYAEWLKNEIKEKSGLPERARNSAQEKWINANELAIFILDRQLGINQHHHVSKSPGERSYFVLLIASTTLAQGTETEMSSASALIDSLVKQTSKSQELISTAKELIEKVVKLRDELEKLTLTHKLPGTCSYCKI